MSRMSALIVGNSLGVRRELVSLITSYSQFGTLIVAGSFDEAQRIVRTFLPDLIIYDLPIADSGDALAIRELRKAVPDAGIIVISLYDDYRIPAIQAGADEFVAKTAPMDNLREAVEHLCPPTETVS